MTLHATYRMGCQWFSRRRGRDEVYTVLHVYMLPFPCCVTSRLWAASVSSCERVLRLGTVVMGTMEFGLQNQGVWLSGHALGCVGWSWSLQTKRYSVDLEELCLGNMKAARIVPYVCSSGARRGRASKKIMTEKSKVNDPPRGRTWNLLIRSQTLCH